VRGLCVREMEKLEEDERVGEFVRAKRKTGRLKRLTASPIQERCKRPAARRRGLRQGRSFWR
jgi:hypothetical protein